LKLIYRYGELTDKLLAVDLAIAGKLQDFYLQSQVVAPISSSLVQLTRDEVLAAEQRIGTLHAIYSKIIPLTTLAAILMLFYIARLIHHSITRNVLNLAKAATEFSEGNLESRVAEESSDELGRLAAIFNNMATRLKDLIDNLESKVARRTEELARSEERFRQLFDHSSSGVIVYEPVDNGREFLIRDFNRAGEEIEQISRAELLGRPVTEAFPGLIAMGLVETFRQVYQTGEPMLHRPAYYKDEHREGWREYRVYKLPSGEIVAVFDDVSQQIRAEEEKQAMAHSLQRAQKMEAIGLMAGGIAHDLNNTLSGIVGYPELLLLQLPEDSTLRRPLITIKKAGERAAAVIADLLTVARGAASTRQTANLNVLVREYLNSPEFGNLMNQYPQIRFEQTLADDLPNISCSPIHVKKCLMNLLANGAESISPAGSVTLATFTQVPDQELANRLDLKMAPHSVLRVTDSGPCIQESDLHHIFEPFYTKRAMGKRSGTGLGLSVVWNTMKDHAGAVAASSTSEGTCFDLYFPASAESLTTPAGKQQTQDLRGAGETILVIDDEPQQCHLARKILEHYGYKVTYSNSGEEAVAYLGSHQADLLILDMIMAPGINGRQTYAEILKIHPEQKAIIASGFSESEDVKATLRMGAGTFIKKPYSMRDLALAVRNGLQNQSSTAGESAGADTIGDGPTYKTKYRSLD
jgi:PAS domain S-box-containing protein